MVHGAKIWANGQLVRDLRPAAWTLAGQTVYGFVDQVSGELLAQSGGSGQLSGTDELGRDRVVAPLTLSFGATAVAQSGISAISEQVVSFACPPHEAGLVDVVAVLDSVALPPLTDGFLYLLDGRLSVTKRAWTNASGLDYATIVTSPDHGGATELLSGVRLIEGTPVWWTYTVAYTYTDPVTGQPTHTGQAGLSDVSVTDSALGQVCDLGQLLVNTPTGCLIDTNFTNWS